MDKMLARGADSGAARVFLREREEEGSKMSREPDPRLMSAISSQPRKPNDAAFRKATQVFEAFKKARVLPDRTDVSRYGSVVFTFHRDVRFAIYECDIDGDIVLTLTDRGSDNEANVKVLSATALDPSIQTAQDFLG